jgi:hypothetical protein
LLLALILTMSFCLPLTNSASFISYYLHPQRLVNTFRESESSDLPMVPGIATD